MTSKPRDEHGGGLSLQTLILASLSSGLAALIVSRLWRAGTVVSAALMPVLVAMMSEMLRRPTDRITRAARPLAQAARPRRGGSDRAGNPPRFGDEGPPPRIHGGRRIRVQAALVTAALAFLIAAAALTLPELLLFDRSVAGGSDRTTYFGGSSPAAPESESSPGEAPQTTTDQAPPTTETAPPTDTAPETTTAPAPTQPPSGGEPAPGTPAPAPSAPQR